MSSADEESGARRGGMRCVGSGTAVLVVEMAQMTAIRAVLWWECVFR